MRTPTPVLVLTLVACGAPDPAPLDTGATSTLPGHNECLAVGEQMDEATCLAVIEADGRSPNLSSDKSSAPAPVPDLRLEDPEHAWVTSEVERCTCVCCHNGPWEGPGVHRWDISFEPVWTDSMSDWSMRVFAGIQESEDQVLPSSDPGRLRAFVEAELQRRLEARSE